MIPNLSSDRLLLCWNLSAAVAVFVPLLVLTVSRLMNSAAPDYSNYNQQQEQYDNYEQQQEQYENYEQEQQYNDYGVDYGEEEYGQQQEQYDNYQQEQYNEEEYGEEGNGGNNRQLWGNSNGYAAKERDDYWNHNDQSPRWWLAGTRAYVDPLEPNACLILMYIYALGLFLALILYGNRVIRRSTEFQTLQGILFCVANFAILVMLLLAGLEGGVQVDGTVLEEQGFYGQLGVCVFLTCFLWFLHGMFFSCLLACRRGSEVVDDYTTPSMKAAAEATGSYIKC